MADGAAFIGGGLLAGFGKGVMDIALEEARNQKQVMLRKMDQEFRTSEREAGQEFKSSERVAGQEFTAGENQAGREFKADEAEKGRKHQSGLLSNTRQIVGPTGEVFQEGPGGKAVPVTTDDGEPVKSVVKDASGKSSVFQQKLAVAKAAGYSDEDAMSYAGGRSTLSDRQLMLAAKKLAAQETSGMIRKPPPATIDKRAKQIYDEIKAMDAGTGVHRSGQPAQRPAARDGTSRKPAPSSVDLPIQPAKQGRGTGTAADPFRPDSEDAFRMIRPGEYFINPADGRVYKKK